MLFRWATSFSVLLVLSHTPASAKELDKFGFQIFGGEKLTIYILNVSVLSK